MEGPSYSPHTAGDLCFLCIFRFKMNSSSSVLTKLVWFSQSRVTKQTEERLHAQGWLCWPLTQTQCMEIYFCMIYYHFCSGSNAASRIYAAWKSTFDRSEQVNRRVNSRLYSCWVRSDFVLFKSSNDFTVFGGFVGVSSLQRRSWLFSMFLWDCLRWEEADSGHARTMRRSKLKAAVAPCVWEELDLLKSAKRFF